jgi:hypothetical protein
MIKTHKKNIAVPVIALTAFVAVGVGYFVYQHRTPVTPYLPKAPNVNMGAKASSSPAPASSGGSVQTPTPANIPVSMAPQKSANGLIVVDTPTEGSVLTSGSTVTGQAAATNGRLYFTVKGKESGQIAGGGPIRVASLSNQPTQFSFTINFTNQVVTGDEGVLEIYGLNSSGQEENLVSIAVGLK